MKIYNRDGKELFDCDLESLKESLEYAIRQGARLDHASLDGASLDGASLDGASLDGASLVGARLDHARLVGAAGINRYRTTPLYMLLDQIASIRAYKLVDANNEGPYSKSQGYGSIRYMIGEKYSVKDADMDEHLQCGAGINLSTLDWCMREWKEGYHILIAEFMREDIAAIPIGSDGKFRVRCCKIVGEKDLMELGLINPLNNK